MAVNAFEIVREGIRTLIRKLWVGSFKGLYKDSKEEARAIDHWKFLNVLSLDNAGRFDRDAECLKRHHERIVRERRFVNWRRATSILLTALTIWIVSSLLMISHLFLLTTISLTVRLTNIRIRLIRIVFNVGARQRSIHIRIHDLLIKVKENRDHG